MPGLTGNRSPILLVEFREFIFQPREFLLDFKCFINDYLFELFDLVYLLFVELFSLEGYSDSIQIDVFSSLARLHL